MILLNFEHTSNLLFTFFSDTTFHLNIISILKLYLYLK